jgi:hypothetical protein
MSLHPVRAWPRPLATFLAFAFLVTLAVASRAQSARSATPDLLPRELVEALLRPYLGLYTGSGATFAVGRVPESLAPYLFVPPGARVLGGIESPSNTIVVLSVSTSVEDLRASYRREQLRLGWTPPSPGGSRGGFVPAPGTGQEGNSLVFCHIGQSLQIVPYPSTAGSLLVTATVQTYSGLCGNQVRFMSTSPSGIELPVLLNPDGAGMNSPTCYASNLSSMGGNNTSERLQTNLSPAQLIDHFSRQLSDSGWGVSATNASIRRSWTRPDSGGMSREVTLTITPSQVNGCMDVSMQARRLTAR